MSGVLTPIMAAAPAPTALPPNQATAAPGRTAAAPAPKPPGISELVDARIAQLLTTEAQRWRPVDPLLATPVVALAQFVSHGGKRLRPTFCFWAFVGAGGDPEDAALVDVCAALELLHAFALLHDDVMDGSTRRRNESCLHVELSAEHERGGWAGEARRFGEGVAVLVGDLAFVYADLLIGDANRDVRRLFDELRVELHMGQYLDLVGAAQRCRDPERARRIAVLKSGKYTIERPLHLGAAMAASFDRLAGPLSAVGVPLGEAFQLRDDLLGAFGEPAQTGKPVGEDFRDGKSTPLLSFAHRVASQRRDRLSLVALDRVGDPDLDDLGVQAIRAALLSTGACDAMEARIRSLANQARMALAAARLTSDASAALDQLCVDVAWRSA